MGDSNSPDLRSQQVGRCGELLVQYRLLKLGVESAPLTTDYGIDLLAFHPRTGKAVRIQVKTTRPRKDEWVEWPLPERETDLVAFVDLDRDRVWVFHSDELKGDLPGKQGTRIWWYVAGKKPDSARTPDDDYWREHESDVWLRRKWLAVEV